MKYRSAIRIAGYIVAGVFAGAALVSSLALSEASARRKALAQGSQLLDTPYGRIEYKVWGEGTPVLVLHGAGGGYDQGELLARTFGGGRHTWIAVSRFGYLRSERLADASTPAQAGVLVSLLDELGYDRAYVLAMSGGVPPALQLCARYPDRVEAMALLSSAPFTPFGASGESRPIPPEMYNAIAGNDVVYWLMARLARKQVESAFDARPELLEAAPQDQAFVRSLVDTVPPASDRLMGLQNEAAAIDPDTAYGLDEITARLLVVHAEDDRLNPVSVGEAISAQVRGAEFLRLSSGGHLLLGHHEALRRRIADFFAGQVPA